MSATHLITLFILSVLVFFSASLLPGDLGRNILGGLASEEDVARFNHNAGVDRPLIVQYLDWISSFVRGDLGTSLQYNVSVSSLLGPAFVNSLKLAAVAFVLVVPLSILGGLVAGLRRGSLTDRIITITGVSFTAIPEFVTTIVLVLVLGLVDAGRCRHHAQGSNVATQMNTCSTQPRPRRRASATSPASPAPRDRVGRRRLRAPPT